MTDLKLAVISELLKGGKGSGSKPGVPHPHKGHGGDVEYGTFNSDAIANEVKGGERAPNLGLRDNSHMAGGRIFKAQEALRSSGFPDEMKPHVQAAQRSLRHAANHFLMGNGKMATHHLQNAHQHIQAAWNPKDPTHHAKILEASVNTREAMNHLEDKPLGKDVNDLRKATLEAMEKARGNRGNTTNHPAGPRGTVGGSGWADPKPGEGLARDGGPDDAEQARQMREYYKKRTGRDLHAEMVAAFGPDYDKPATTGQRPKTPDAMEAMRFKAKFQKDEKLEKTNSVDRRNAAKPKSGGGSKASKPQEVEDDDLTADPDSPDGMANSGAMGTSFMGHIRPGAMVYRMEDGKFVPIKNGVRNVQFTGQAHGLYQFAHQGLHFSAPHTHIVPAAIANDDIAYGVQQMQPGNGDSAKGTSVQKDSNLDQPLGYGDPVSRVDTENMGVEVRPSPNLPPGKKKKAKNDTSR